MSSAAQFLNAAEAASRLGVSAKALRLYEQRGLLKTVRTAAGWRTYGPEQMARGREIVALRKLGLSLAQIKRALQGEPEALSMALAAHQEVLERDVGALATSLARVQELRARIADGHATSLAEVSGIVGAAPAVVFDLPWPWGGERFELDRPGPLTWLTGPLGSGKTKLALKLSESLPGASFLGLDRMADAGLSKLGQDELDALVAEGARVNDALAALLAGMTAAGDGPIVIDLIERGLDAATQEALSNRLRTRGRAARPVIAMTRSTGMLDLDALNGETIIYCPANHAPPLVIRGFAGAPGLDLVASCLASPDVRARTEGTMATRSSTAA